MVKLLELVVDRFFICIKIGRTLCLLFFCIIYGLAFSQESVLVVKEEDIVKQNNTEFLLKRKLRKELRRNVHIKFICIESQNILAKYTQIPVKVTTLYPRCIMRENNWMKVEIGRMNKEETDFFIGNREKTLHTSDVIVPAVFEIDTNQMVSKKCVDTIQILNDFVTLKEKKYKVKTVSYTFSDKYKDYLRTVNFSHYAYVIIGKEIYNIVSYRRYCNLPQNKVLRNNYSIIDPEHGMVNCMIVMEELEENNNP